MLCPAGIVTGRFSARRNSELVDPSDEMVTAAFDAVSVACRLTLDPTVTLPKLRVAGLTASLEFTVTSPNPMTFIVSMECLAVLMSSKTPVLYPLAVGLKMTGKSTLAPGWRFTGKRNVPNKNSLPCFDMEVICSVLLPLFESRKE